MPALFQVVRSQHPRLVRALRAAVVLSLVLTVLGGLGFGWEYHRYSRVVDRRIARSPLFVMIRPRPAQRAVRGGRFLPAASVERGSSRGPVAAYNRIPPELVQAVVAIEDRRFFEHSGVNYARTMECAVQDAFTFHLACGASTLTQQLARTSFLSQQKTFKRKAAEFMIARRLEERFNKQQIFALYASQINLGQSGPAPIRGFGQASHVYFDEHLNQLDLAQCALLAGMIQRPNYFNPFRHPERALARRNLVLEAMVSTGAITRVQADAAKAEPLHLVALDSLPYAPDNGASALG